MRFCRQSNAIGMQKRTNWSQSWLLYSLELYNKTKLTFRSFVRSTLAHVLFLCSFRVYSFIHSESTVNVLSYNVSAWVRETTLQHSQNSRTSLIVCLVCIFGACLRDVFEVCYRTVWWQDESFWRSFKVKFTEWSHELCCGVVYLPKTRRNELTILCVAPQERLSFVAYLFPQLQWGKDIEP